MILHSSCSTRATQERWKNLWYIRDVGRRWHLRSFGNMQFVKMIYIYIYIYAVWKYWIQPSNMVSYLDWSNSKDIGIFNQPQCGHLTESCNMVYGVVWKWGIDAQKMQNDDQLCNGMGYPLSLDKPRNVSRMSQMICSLQFHVISTCPGVLSIYIIKALLCQTNR